MAKLLTEFNSAAISVRVSPAFQVRRDEPVAPSMIFRQSGVFFTGVAASLAAAAPLTALRAPFPVVPDDEVTLFV